MAQYWAFFDRGRSAQRVSYHRSQCAHARDRGPQRSPESIGGDYFAFVLGMAMGRLWTHFGHSGYRDAQGDLRSRAGLAALGKLARRLNHFEVKSATVFATSPSCWKRRIAAIPAAPVSRQARAFSGVNPPLAITGMDTALQTCLNFASPCGGPKVAFEGVSKTVPKKTKSL